MSGDETNGFTLFPEAESDAVPANIVLTMPPAEVAKLKNSVERPSAMIGGCVDYIDPLSAVHRQTPFIYEVVEIISPDIRGFIEPVRAQFPIGTYSLAIRPGLAGNAD